MSIISTCILCSNTFKKCIHYTSLFDWRLDTCICTICLYYYKYTYVYLYVCTCHSRADLLSYDIHEYNYFKDKYK